MLLPAVQPASQNGSDSVNLFRRHGLKLMRNVSRKHGHRQRCSRSALFFTTTIAIFISCYLHGQTSSTGALTGVALDPTGAFLPGVVVRLTNPDTRASTSVTCDNEGRFTFLLLPPGRYEVKATGASSEGLVWSAMVSINVTETLSLELHLQLATVVHSIGVYAEPLLVQTDNSSLGRIVDR